MILWGVQVYSWISLCPGYPEISSNQNRKTQIIKQAPRSRQAMLMGTKNWCKMVISQVRFKHKTLQSDYDILSAIPQCAWNNKQGCSILIRIYIFCPQGTCPWMCPSIKPLTEIRQCICRLHSHSKKWMETSWMEWNPSLNKYTHFVKLILAWKLYTYVGIHLRMLGYLGV